jgi:hypothetical protein
VWIYTHFCVQPEKNLLNIYGIENFSEKGVVKRKETHTLCVKYIFSLSFTIFEIIKQNDTMVGLHFRSFTNILNCKTVVSNMTMLAREDTADYFIAFNFVQNLSFFVVPSASPG